MKKCIHKRKKCIHIATEEIRKKNKRIYKKRIYKTCFARERNIYKERNI
ncbi:MAG: hypothetical protein ACI4TX_02505 [Christensenellales bacterium]